MASTATRLYSWGGLVEGDRLQGVQLGEVLKGFRVRKEVVEVNGMMQQQHMECTNKRVYQLHKQQLFQQMKEKLVPVPLSLKVLEIACGNGHIICRTANKQVYTWGHGLNGQLGHGHTHN
jgi:alpha-tubulin suppressor-like RCC1 family protein